MPNSCQTRAKRETGIVIVRFGDANTEGVKNTNKFELNERQKKAVEYIKINGKITTNGYIRLAGVSHKTVKRDSRKQEIKLLQGF